VTADRVLHVDDRLDVRQTDRHSVYRALVNTSVLIRRELLRNDYESFVSVLGN